MSKLYAFQAENHMTKTERANQVKAAQLVWTHLRSLRNSSDTEIDQVISKWSNKENIPLNYDNFQELKKLRQNKLLGRVTKSMLDDILTPFINDKLPYNVIPFRMA